MPPLSTPYKRQRTLHEFANSSSPTRTSGNLKGRKPCNDANSGDSSDNDLGRIEFEPAIGVADTWLHSVRKHADEESSVTCCAKKSRTSSSVVSVGSSDSSSLETRQPGLRKRLGSSRKPKRIISTSEESDTQQPRKKRKMVRGQRPKSTPLEGEESSGENLIEEVDKDRILNSRLRDRSKKSVFAYNLERLQRHRQGRVSPESNDEDTDTSMSSSVIQPAMSKLFEGAHPSETVFDDDDNSSDWHASWQEDESNFIVEDNGAEDMPELPTMFNMGTFQDLSHHFKVICQLFVHLAVKEPHQRHTFMKEVLVENYFSVPLAIARRKFSGIRDSLVTSSIWKTEFKSTLETFPVFRLEHLAFATPTCDACHLSNRVATFRGMVSGHAYNPLTYESRLDPGKPHEVGRNVSDWSLGRFCAARSQLFHTFTHWEYILYHSLRMEVDRLREATTHKASTRRNEETVFIPYTDGPPPPEDLEDADGTMDWLDGRGIINAQWAKVKEMMERAHKLDVKGVRAEDDIELA